MNPKFNKPNLTANLSNPLSACWQTTKKCNYTCSHCIAAANPANLEELNTKNMKKIINKLSTAGIVRIDFTGGEPLLRKDMCKIIDYATKRGIYSILTSNGSVWSKKIENCLKRNMSLIQISIDGDEKTHEKLRISGSYAKALDTLRKFTSAGIKTRINFTVTKLNYRKIRFIYGLAKKNKISRLMYIMAAPQGRAANYENKFCLSEAQYKLAKKNIESIKEESKGVFITIHDYKVNFKSCFLIESNGDVISQGYRSSECSYAGNILKDSVTKIWNSGHFDHLKHILQYSYLFD